MVSHRSGEWPLVGRDDLVARLLAIMRDAASSGAVIEGPAGTGKTRLAREIAARTASDDGPVDVVVATTTASAIPLGAFAGVLPPAPGDGHGDFDDLQWARRALVSGTVSSRLLLVDDAHHLDASSATLVHHTAAAGGRRLLVTVRSGEPVPDAVSALWKDGYLARFELPPLSLDDTRELLQAVIGGDVEAATVQQLWRTTAGNPMFLRELVLAASIEGSLSSTGGVWRVARRLPVPTSIEALLRERLATLPAVERDALTTLAVAERLELDVLQALHPDADLSVLEREGLLAVAPEVATPTVELGHPMHGEVVRSLTPATARIAVARRLGETVEAAGHVDPADALRVARWRVVAGKPVPLDLLVTAVGQAHVAGDFDLAERFARSPVAGDDAAPPAVRLMLATLLMERGAYHETLSVLDELSARDLARPDAVRAAELRARVLFYGMNSGSHVDAMLGQAIADLDTPPALVESQAWMRFMGGHPDDAVAALAVLPEGGRTTVIATVVEAWCRAVTGDVAGAVRLAEDALRRAQSGGADTKRDLAWAELALCTAQQHAGLLVEAGRVAEYRYSWPGTLPAYIRARWAWALASVREEQGRLTEAVTAYRRSAAINRRVGQDGYVRGTLAGLARCAAQAGRRDEAVAALAEIDALPATPVRLYDGATEAARGWTAAAAGDVRTAVRHVAAAAAAAREAGLVVEEARWLHDAIRMGDRSAEHVDRLALLARDAAAPPIVLRAGHARALAAGGADDLLAAASRLEEGGMLLLAAEALIDAARALHATERRRATRVSGRAETLLERCGEVRTPTLRDRAAVDPLTPREREIVVMAASGRSSSEIAAHLVLSVRTVDNHLHRAYRKLGVRSRPEAAAALGMRR